MSRTHTKLFWLSCQRDLRKSGWITASWRSSYIKSHTRTRCPSGMKLQSNCKRHAAKLKLTWFYAKLSPSLFCRSLNCSKYSLYWFISAKLDYPALSVCHRALYKSNAYFAKKYRTNIVAHTSSSYTFSSHHLKKSHSKIYSDFKILLVFLF